MTVSISEEAVEAAAIAIDALWSDGDKRDIAFSQTEREYQDHCRSTARAALLAAASLRGDGEPLAIPAGHAVVPSQHEWEPSQLGHGVKICKHCRMTLMEASVLGVNCDAAPASPPLVTEGETVPAGDIPALLDRYWDLAIAEGREGRDHDTPNGDAQETRTKLNLAFIAGMQPFSNTPHKEGLRAALPADVVELVIAARIVAFEDQSPEALRQLDKASEAFAELVPWDNEPAEALSSSEVQL